jgi:competence CoiA-like predicted nuclease
MTIFYTDGDRKKEAYMPFIAIDKISGKRIDITTIEKPKQTLRDGQFVCQLCEQPMFIRSGDIRITHFYHKAVCHSDIFVPQERETEEHLFGKKEIARMLREQFNNQHVLIEYERPLKEIRRVADILITYPMGWRLAQEIQLSDISEKEIEERTNAYESIGIDVIWWLGKKVRLSTRDWCIERFGRVYTIKIIRDSTDRAISLPDFT